MTDAEQPVDDSPQEHPPAAAAVGRLWSVTLDCADAPGLGQFWVAVTGGRVAHTSEQFVGVETPAGVWIGAYQVPDYRPPTWSGEASDKQFHLDIAVTDLDAAESAVSALGAVKAEHQPEPDRWRVFHDPAGHPFCITTIGA